MTVQPFTLLVDIPLKPGRADEVMALLNDVFEAMKVEETFVGATALHSPEDLDTILLAQDFHDLSSQIIQKIIKLLKDMELKLVSLIRTFGVKADTCRQKEDAELYGPAHAAMESAVHSQDEVDSLLAEFGF